MIKFLKNIFGILFGAFFLSLIYSMIVGVPVVGPTMLEEYAITVVVLSVLRLLLLLKR